MQARLRFTQDDKEMSESVSGSDLRENQCISQKDNNIIDECMNYSNFHLTQPLSPFYSLYLSFSHYH